MLRQGDWHSLSITSRHYFTRERSNVIASGFFFQIDTRSFLIEHTELPLFHYDFFRYFLILLWFVIIIIILNKFKWKRNTTFLKSFTKSIFSLFCCWFTNKKAISHVSLLPLVTIPSPRFGLLPSEAFHIWTIHDHVLTVLMKILASFFQLWPVYKVNWPNSDREKLNRDGGRLLQKLNGWDGKELNFLLLRKKSY